MKKQSGLGRGIDYLFDDSVQKEEIIGTGETGRENGVTTILLDDLCAGAYQPRTFFAPEQLEQLSQSIKNQGIIQPILVRKLHHKKDNANYEIIAGERRFRAAKIAGLTEIPCIIKDYTDSEAMTVALIENLQRQDLNPIEEAAGYEKLKEMHGFSQEELAEKLGKSRSAVANAIRLLTLPEKIQNYVKYNTIQKGHARTLLAITDNATRLVLCEATIEFELSVREMESAVEYWKVHNVLPSSITGKEPYKEPKIKLTPSKLITEINNKLKNILHKNATIKGTEEKGTIQISYNNNSELVSIINKLEIRS